MLEITVPLPVIAMNSWSSISINSSSAMAPCTIAHCTIFTVFCFLSFLHFFSLLISCFFEEGRFHVKKFARWVKIGKDVTSSIAHWNTLFNWLCGVCIHQNKLSTNSNPLWMKIVSRLFQIIQRIIARVSKILWLAASHENHYNAPLTSTIITTSTTMQPAITTNAPN